MCTLTVVVNAIAVSREFLKYHERFNVYFYLVRITRSLVAVEFINTDRNNSATLPPMNETPTALPLHESQTSPSLPGDRRNTPVHVLISPAPSNLFYGTETQRAPPPGELGYSAPNARPPGTVNNRAYEPDPIYDLKYADPPSYDEAIKAMHYKPPEEPDHRRYHLYPDQGQFSTSEPYFYHQTCNNELETELAKSFCSRIIFAIIIFGFAACAIRVLCYLT